MTRQLISLATFSLLMSGCSIFGPTSAVAPGSPNAEVEQTAKAKKKAGATDEKVEAAAAKMRERRVGDLFVHRYSGTYRAAPVTLTEEVVDRQDQLLVIEYTLEESGRETRLRVHMDTRNQEVLGVWQLAGDLEVKVEVSDLEALLAKTTYAPDYNEGKVARKHATCLIVGKEQDCTTTRYHVFIGDDPATLVVTQSDAVPGRDVAGSIEDAEGVVLYEAELIQMRRGAPEPAVAQRAVGKDYTPEGL